MDIFSGNELNTTETIDADIVIVLLIDHDHFLNI